MRAQTINVKQAAGRILCCTIFRAGGKKLLAKGHVISDEDAKMLETEGMNQVWVTELEEGEIAAAVSREGKPLRDALAEAGFAGRPRERLDPARYVGYLEAHIEQGDTLDSSGRRIGIVEAIIGSWNYWVTITGEQNISK